jgi:hypothetical protein
MIDAITIEVIGTSTYGIPDYYNVTFLTGMTTYQHSITAQGGCESCTIDFDAPINKASDYTGYVLRHVVAYDQYGVAIWRGFINRVVIDYGSTVTSVGVESLASNYVLYSNNTFRATLSDSLVAQAYAEKTRVVRANLNAVSATFATQILTQELTLHGAPSVETRTTAETRTRQQCKVRFECLGWYSIAQWKTIGATALAGTGNDTATDIVTYINAVLSPNAWFQVGAPLASTGVINSTTNSWQAHTLYSQVLNDLFQAGTSTGQVLSYGVDAQGIFEFQASQINTVNVHYTKSLASAAIFSEGIEVPPTQIVPDKNLTIQELQPMMFVYGKTYPGLQYINRVSLQMDRNGYQLVLEPTNLNDVNNDLARMRTKDKFARSTT